MERFIANIFLFLAIMFLLFIALTQARWFVDGDTETIKMGLATLGFFGSLFMFGYVNDLDGEEENF